MAVARLYNGVPGRAARADQTRLRVSRRAAAPAWWPGSTQLRSGRSAQSPSRSAPSGRADCFGATQANEDAMPMGAGSLAAWLELTVRDCARHSTRPPNSTTGRGPVIPRRCSMTLLCWQALGRAAGCWRSAAGPGRPRCRWPSEATRSSRLNTYSGHRAMAPAARQGLLGCIAKRHLTELRVAHRRVG
jgi:hypothetical protein